MARKNDYIEEIDKFIGNKIYSLRLAKGLSRQQLSQVIGVTHQQRIAECLRKAVPLPSVRTLISEEWFCIFFDVNPIERCG